MTCYKVYYKITINKRVGCLSTNRRRGHIFGKVALGGSITLSHFSVPEGRNQEHLTN